MSCLGGACWNKHAMGVRLACMSAAVSFSQFVDHVVCVRNCRHGHEREYVLPLPLDGEGYNIVRDVAHPFDKVGVLGESGVRGAVSYEWSHHDRIERTAHAWLSESCGSR
jgi:hypothetical protein